MSDHEHEWVEVTKLSEADERYICKSCDDIKLVPFVPRPQVICLDCGMRGVPGRGTSTVWLPDATAQPCSHDRTREVGEA